MTKRDIVARITAEIGLPASTVSKVVQQTLDAIIESLAADGRIELRDFAVFEVCRRKARKARNPRTGEVVMVPDRAAVKFTPGKEMSRRVCEATDWKGVEKPAQKAKPVGAR